MYSLKIQKLHLTLLHSERPMAIQSATGLTLKSELMTDANSEDEAQPGHLLSYWCTCTLLVYWYTSTNFRHFFQRETTSVT